MPFTVSAWGVVRPSDAASDAIVPNSDCLSINAHSVIVSEWKASITMGSYMWMTEWRHDIRQVLPPKDCSGLLNLVLSAPPSTVSSTTPMLVQQKIAQDLLTLLQSRRRFVEAAVACNKLRARHIEVFDAWILALQEAGESGGILFY